MSDRNIRQRSSAAEKAARPSITNYLGEQQIGRIKTQAMGLYESALENREKANAIEDIDQKSAFLRSAEPQLPNAIAYAYADIINDVLENMDPPATVHAATSSQRGSGTSSLALFNITPELAPSLQEFSEAIASHHFKCTAVMTRMLGNGERFRAMETPRDPAWREVEGLKVAGTVNQKG